MRIIKKYKSHIKAAKKTLAKSNLMLLGAGRGSLFANKYLDMNHLLASLKQLKFIISKFVYLYSYDELQRLSKSKPAIQKKTSQKSHSKFRIVIVCENNKAKETYLSNYIQKITKRQRINNGKGELNLDKIICTRPINKIRKFYRTGAILEGKPSLYFATNDSIFLELKKLLGERENINCSLVYNKELYGQGYWSLPAGLDTWFFFKYQLLFLISYISLLLRRKNSGFLKSLATSITPDANANNEVMKKAYSVRDSDKFKSNYKNKNKNNFNFKEDYKKAKYNNKNKNLNNKQFKN